MGRDRVGRPDIEAEETYNGQPLCYAALAAQKSFNTLYLLTATAARTSTRR